MKITLKTITSGTGGTFGVLLDPYGAIIATTCEDPWKNNAVGSSCIPAGVYEVESYSSPKHPMAYHLKDVPGRTLILIHEGNTIEDTEGCILVGSGFGMLGKMPAITSSVAKLKELVSVLPRNFTLEVIR